MTKQIKQNYVFFFILLTIILGATLWLIKSYIPIIFFAFIFAAIARPIYFWLYKKLNKNGNISSIITQIILLVGLLIPISLLSILALNQAQVIASDVRNLSTQTLDQYDSIDGVLDAVNNVLAGLPGDYEISQEDIVSRITGAIGPVSEFIVNRAVAVGSSTLNILSNTLLFLILLHSFLIFQPKLVQYLKRLSPLDDSIDSLLFKKVIAMSKSMLQGTLVIALIQAIIGGLTLWAVGFPYPFFWALISIFLAVIPGGTGLLQFPLALVEILLGNYVSAAIIVLVHLLITTNIDNVLRPKLVSDEAKLPEALTLVGVFGGLTVFGFFGFVYGPVIMILFKSILDIYLEHYKNS